MFDRSKPFNVISALPPSAEIENDPEILKKLVSASRALATVDGNINRLANPLMLVNTIALQEAKTSTEIENIFTTEDELYKAVSDSVKERNADPATKEVLKYREALWTGYNLIRETGKIDHKIIIGIYQKIKETNSSYRPPQANVVIRRGQSEFRSGEIVYTPPRGEGLVENLMDNLIQYLNDNEKHKLDPLLKMSIAHYQFEAIHPFQDGNGRTGRILNLLYLVNQNLLSHPVLYMSKYIIINKDDYYFNLGAVSQRNAWKSWILYMLDAIEQTSHLTNNIINEILEQMDSTLSYTKSKIKWYNKEVNELLFSQPYIKPSSIGNVVDKSSRTTLTKYVNELIQYKVLTPKKDGLEVYYLNNDLIRILEG
ncbi:MAG: Fic/DOC family N-terminal domain-containing protein [Bacteroidales bacterium]